MKEYTFQPPSIGDESQGWALLSVCWAFVTCAFISTALRVWVRVKLTRNLGIDDYVMMTAMFTTIIGAALITCEVTVGGLGRHQFYLSFAQKRNFMAIAWSDWIQTFVTLALTKISICFFLLRIVDARKIRLALYGLIGFTALFSAVCVFIFLGVCRPLKAYWDIGIPHAVCLSDEQVEKVVLAQGILSILTDLICAAFPILFLRNLQVPLRTKFALCALMGLGIITAACCVVRTALSGALTKADITWEVVANVGWRLPEVNIGIFCANAPILRPLYLFFRGKLESQRSARSYDTVSKGDRFVMPGNTAWVSGDSATVQGSEGSVAAGGGGGGGGGWPKKGSVDESVSMEMGMPIRSEGRVSGRKEAWA